jgi:KaiC/GvpD/RAD55 family RecA-like ATPase
MEAVPSSQLIAEFIEALDEEIAAIKAGKGGSTTRVFDGRFVRESVGVFVYSFTLENFIATMDDAPVEVQVGASRYQGQIIQTRGLEVIVGVEHDFGASIAEARLMTNLYFLHELLKKKFEAIRSGEASGDFALAQGVFQGATGNSAERVELPPMEPGPTNPNPSQLAAIQASQGQRLTLVWGPPGTGKTETLARTVECFVKRGMRVLVVAHSNAAVDEATEDIAQVLKATEYYNEGKIIRLGNVQKHSLTEEYDLVLLGGIAERLGASLKEEREELERRRSEVDRRLAELASALDAMQERESATRQERQLAEALVSSKKEISRVATRLAKHEDKLGTTRARLQRAESAGVVKRLVLNLDPAKIRRDMHATTVQLDGSRRQLHERESRHHEIETQLSDTRARLASLENQLGLLLGAWRLSETKLHAREEELKAEKNEIAARIADIQKELEEIQRRVLSEARVICTTLTKTFTARELPDTPFDVLVLDEASMAPMPYLYWALGRCRRAAVIVGDFLQLPPICVADQDMAQRWLGRSIYAQLGVPAEARRAEGTRLICLLKYQYRMNPRISSVANGLFYDNLLEDDSSVRDHTVSDGLSESALTIIDTSEASPWCSRLSTGGRFNVYSALLAATAAKRILERLEPGSTTIGIITPYSHQARLIRKIVEDMNLEIPPDSVSTVHRFQGGEREVIVLDTVEGPGVKIAPMLGETTEDSDAPLLLNVALTRARCKVFMVANLKYLKRELNAGTALQKILQRFEAAGEIIECSDLVDSYFTRDFEKWVDRFIDAAQSQVAEPPEGSLFSERSFYPAFFEDLRNAREEVVILSPFLSVKRSGNFVDLFRALVQRGVKVTVYTRPPKSQVGDFALGAAEVVDQLRAIEVEVIERWKMHQKVAIIDRKVGWEGSLNILSHRDSGEQMRRLPFGKAVNELMRLCEVDESSGVDTRGRREPVRTLELCQTCKKHEMVIRVSRYGAFLSCPDRECPGKRHVNRWDRIVTHVLCPDTGDPMILRQGSKGPFLGCSAYPECKKTMGLR